VLWPLEHFDEAVSSGALLFAGKWALESLKEALSSLSIGSKEFVDEDLTSSSVHNKREVGSATPEISPKQEGRGDKKSRGMQKQ
jgi:hypothetical protein